MGRKLKTKRNCPYCNVGRGKTGKNFADIYYKMIDNSIRINRNELGMYSLVFEIDEPTIYREAYSTDIKFCPMCGRKLGD